VENHPVALWCQHIVKVVYCKCDRAYDTNGRASTETAGPCARHGVPCQKYERQ